MKIEESFVTLSHSELKYFCKKAALRFQRGFDETEFIIFFQDQKNGLVSQGRMSELIFNTWVELEEKNDPSA